MATFNKITIVGYLGRDPELRYTPQGTAVCNISIATTEKRGNEQTTTWFKVTVWGKQAELCNQYLAKGRQLYVEGRVSLQEYTNRDGNKRSSLEVNASDIKFLGPSNGSGEDVSDKPAQAVETESNPNPKPKTLGDLVTPKQLWMIRNTARELGIDAESACRSRFHCPLEEISKQAASALIEYIKQVGQGLAEQNAEQDEEIPF